LKKQHLRELTELREARRQELYAYVPEANRNRIFRIFFNLYKDGEFLKNADTVRRQQWDDEVIRTLMDYCGDTTKNNYLLHTHRRWGENDPLLDVNYDMAVSKIKEMVFSNNFSGYINLR
jgi:hypothetical protein